MTPTRRGTGGTSAVGWWAAGAAALGAGAALAGVMLGGAAAGGAGAAGVAGALARPPQAAATRSNPLRTASAARRRTGTIPTPRRRGLHDDADDAVVGQRLLVEHRPPLADLPAVRRAAQRVLVAPDVRAELPQADAID